MSDLIATLQGAQDFLRVKAAPDLLAIVSKPSADTALAAAQAMSYVGTALKAGDSLETALVFAHDELRKSGKDDARWAVAEVCFALAEGVKR